MICRRCHIARFAARRFGPWPYTRYPRPVNPAAAVSNQQWPPDRFRCSPVTPDTKVPFIETAQLPGLSRGMAYFEGCEDLDNARTPQSYPDAKYVPLKRAEN